MEELAALRKTVARASRGHGQWCLIEGEAGIGKSRLLEALTTDAVTMGFDVRCGAAEELDVAPFAALADALRKDLDVPALLLRGVQSEGIQGGGAFEARYRVIEALVSWVGERAKLSPLALFVEDLQWADPSSIAALRSLVRRTRDLPVLVVGTLRPPPGRPELAALVELARAEATATHLPLGPLEPEAIERLITGLAGAPPGPGLASHLTRAAGNPFYVIELFDALLEEGALELRDGQAEATAVALTPGRRLTLLHRLQSLSPPTNEALRLAAVLGPTFAPAQLASVLGRSPVEVAATLAEAAAAGLIGEAGGRLAFRHELLREAIYGDMTGPVRVGLHLHVGRVLAEEGAPVLQVAEHMALGAAPGDQQAVRWLHDASRQVVSANPGIAADLVTRALELSDPADPRRPAMIGDLVTALSWSGRYADAEALARGALDLPVTPAAASLLRLSLVRALVAAGRGSEAYQEVVDLTPDFSTPAGTQLQVEAAWARLLVGDGPGARATAEAAKDGAARTGNEASLCAALVVLGFLAVLGAETDRALDLLGEAVSRAEALGTAEAHQSSPHIMFATALLYADRLTEAKRQLRRGRQLAEQLGAIHDLPIFQLISTVVGFFAGDWDATEQDARAGLELADEIGNRQAAVATWALVAIRAVHANDLGGARNALQNGEAELSAGKNQFHAHWLGWARALYEEARNHSDIALAALGNVWGMCAAGGLICDQPLLGPDLTRLHLAAGQLEEAHLVAQDVATAAATIGSAPAQAAALRCRGLIADDPSILVEAVGVARRGSQPLALGGACTDAATSLIRAGRSAEAVALLEEAVTVYERLGAAREVARASDSLRGLGVRRPTRRRKKGNADGTPALTPAEAAVVALVAEGLTNQEAAERLFISSRTVEAHLAHVFAKLHLQSRAQLIVWYTGNGSPVPSRPPAD